MRKLAEALKGFYLLMLGRFLQKHAEGFKGWDDPVMIPDELLWDRIFSKRTYVMNEDTEKDLIDIANTAMILWWRMRQRRKCRVCGCTEDHSCPGGCSWVAPDLCSACEEKMKPCPVGNDCPECTPLQCIKLSEKKREIFP